VLSDVLNLRVSYTLVAQLLTPLVSLLSGLATPLVLHRSTMQTSQTLALSIALDSILADNGASFSMGSNWTNAGRTVADLGTVTAATSITATDLIGTNVDGILGADTARAATVTTLSLTSMGSNWTNAGRTVADAGILTTVDINGGSIDGTAIGAAVLSTAKFTTISGSGQLDVRGASNLDGAVLCRQGFTSTAAANTLGATSFSDANITNVGDIALDSISADGASFSMGSNWTNAGRTVADGGIFTTLDLNGGSIDGTTIGAAAQSSVKATTLSGSGQGDVVGQFTVHGLTALSGAVELTGVVDTALAVATDSFYYLDVSDNLVKRDSMADYAAAIAGSGLAATAGVLSVDLNEAGAGVVDVAADSFTFIDANDSNAVKKDSYADYAAAIAGDGLKATAGVLSYDASELTEAVVNVAADSFIFLDADGSVTRRDSWADYATAAAGVGLRASAGAFELELSELGAGVIATGDSIAFVDSNDANASKKETVDDLANLFAGVGLSAASAVMALDLNELVAATVNVAADSIAIIDADDSNGSKKESIADLVTAMAGGGLTATNGVLSTQGGSAAGIADANATLAEGMNFGTTTFSADRVWTLPADPDIGDIVHAKAPGSLAGNDLTILKGAALHRIDGAESLEIESDGGAISCMFVGSNIWVLF
jgi:hypothetical protein